MLHILQLFLLLFDPVQQLLLPPPHLGLEPPLLLVPLAGQCALVGQPVSVLLVRRLAAGGRALIIHVGRRSVGASGQEAGLMRCGKGGWGRAAAGGQAGAAAGGGRTAAFSAGKRMFLVFFVLPQCNYTKKREHREDKEMYNTEEENLFVCSSIVVQKGQRHRNSAKMGSQRRKRIFTEIWTFEGHPVPFKKSYRWPRKVLFTTDKCCHIEFAFLQENMRKKA